jgi:hypothetical protein
MRWRRRGAGDTMATDKQALLDQRATVEAHLAELRAQRGGFEDDLAEARALAEGERRSFVAALLGRGKYDAAKLAAARLKVESLPEVLRQLDTQIMAAGAPLAGIERELQLLEGAELSAEALAAEKRMRARQAEQDRDYQALHGAAMRLKDMAAPGEMVNPVWDAAWKLAPVNAATEGIAWRDGGGR